MVNNPIVQPGLEGALERNWYLPVHLSLNGMNERVAAFGVYPEATEGYDALIDLPAPPPPASESYVRAIIERDGLEINGFTNFSRDIREPLEYGGHEQWIYHVEATEAGVVRFDLPEPEFHLPYGHDIIATVNGESYNLYEQSTFEFEVDGESPTELVFDVYFENYSDVEGNDVELPSEFMVSRAFPNPFNPSTTVRYAMPEAGEVQLVLYDALGREILRDAVQRGAGWHLHTIDANGAASGVYFLQVTANGRQDVQKIVLMK
jgi:hypothetical protein